MRRRTAFTLTVFALLVGGWFLGPRWPSDHGADWIVEPGAPPRIIAHAGGLHQFPANTLVAFRGAAALGVDVLEMDVQLTRDEKLATIHDDTVDRTTEGTGRVRALTLAKLQRLDASTDYRRSDGTNPWANERVPHAALGEVLATFADTHLDFVIELKNAGEVGAIAARRLAALLHESGLEARVIVCSFHAETLMAFRVASGGRVATSGATDEILIAILPARFHLDRWWYRPGPVSVLQLPLEAEGLALATAGLVRNAHAHQQAVEYWTINDPADMARLVEIGADGIMTDDPGLLRAVYAERGLPLPGTVVVP
mgnify:CR=1 FL=1